jgi:hypothetical protein
MLHVGVGFARDLLGVEGPRCSSNLFVVFSSAPLG